MLKPLKPYRTLITSFILLMLSSTLNAAPTSHTKVPNWPILPEGVTMGQTTGVAVDSHNHVFVFHRAKRQWKTPFSDKPIEQDTVFMFDGATGQLKRRWGANLFIMPHGLSVDADDNVWVTDVGSHQVHKLSHDGKLLLSLGEARVKGDDAGHFARPTAVSFGKDRSVYVSDGYLNTRVVKFSASGKYISAWGTKGRQSGQFRLPHGIAVSHDRVYVADRDNARIQIFDLNGRFISLWQGQAIGRPYSVAVSDYDEVFIVDGGRADKPLNRVVRLNAEGTVIESFDAGLADYERNLGHDIALGKDGALYAVDVLTHTVLKFISRHRPLHVVKPAKSNF